jgi:hypothetical protein
VKDFIEGAKSNLNWILAHSKTGPQYREGIIVALEDILFRSKSYKGFRYLTEREVPLGKKPGIVRPDKPFALFKFPDETRREYF